MRWPPLREETKAGAVSSHNYGHVPDHGAHKQELLPRDRDGDVCGDRVLVGRSPFGVGMTVQHHREAEGTVVVRRGGSVVMVVGRDVKRRRPANRPGRRQRGHRRDREATHQGTPHEGSIRDEVRPVKDPQTSRACQGEVTARPGQRPAHGRAWPQGRVPGRSGAGTIAAKSNATATGQPIRGCGTAEV